MLQVPKEDILKLVIIDVAGSGWKRWRGLPKGTTAITQAHALADTGIMYYLIEHSNGEVKLFEEEAVVQEKDGNTKTIPTLRFHVGNVDKVFSILLTPPLFATHPPLITMNVRFPGAKSVIVPGFSSD